MSNSSRRESSGHKQACKASASSSNLPAMLGTHNAAHVDRGGAHLVRLVLLPCLLLLLCSACCSSSLLNGLLDGRVHGSDLTLHTLLVSDGLVLQSPAQSKVLVECSHAALCTLHTASTPCAALSSCLERCNTYCWHACTVCLHSLLAQLACTRHTSRHDTAAGSYNQYCWYTKYACRKPTSAQHSPELTL